MSVGFAALALGALGACGADDADEIAIPKARPLDASGCSPVTYGGEGRPDVLIGTVTTLQGQYAGHGIQVAQAMKLVLAQRDWRAGEHKVGLRLCDEVATAGDFPSPAKCRRHARAFARDGNVIVAHGPQTSGCAIEMLAILNRAPGGPLPQVLAGPTYLGLTRAGPGVGPGEPRRYFPTGRRSVVRLTSADDVQGAAGALFAEREGARRVFALNDGETYGAGVAEAFLVAAKRRGLRLVGSEPWDPKAPHYRDLAGRVRDADADAVYLGGYVVSNGPRLIKDLREALGPEAQIIGPDGFNQLDPIVEGAGRAAEGFVASIGVLPNRQLPESGREFAAEFEERFSARPCCFSVHTAEATRMMLDAIARSDGTRAQVLERLFAARVEDSYVGDFEIDRYGDTTLTEIGFYQIDGGRLRYRTAISPPAELLARR